MSRSIGVIDLDGGRRFSVVVGDLLQQPVDAIVNAANGRLAHGGGVAAVIARAGGPALVTEGDALVRERGTIPTGEAVVTTAGRLPFQGVIHAVGPRQGEGDEEEKLTSAVAASLDRAAEREWSKIAMPAISSGIFSVPAEVCARAYVAGARRHLEGMPDSPVRLVRLCLMDGPLIDLMRERIAADQA